MPKVPCPFLKSPKAAVPMTKYSIVAIYNERISTRMPGAAIAGGGGGGAELK